jgi:FAD/FMN-containing dehydrogenase
VQWSNWSGSVHADPVRLEAPANEAAVVDVVTRATRDGLAVRPAGSRHSFTPLCATDGVAVDLHELAGVESVDTLTGIATVLAGTRLAAIGDELRAAGWSLHNQGDVDVQTVSGAIGTGTHGTGPELTNLSAAVVGVRIVTAAGDVVHATEHVRPGLYQAARLSLGALGIVTAVSFQCVPAYNLHERIWFEGPDESLDLLGARIAATRHYEFWWYPFRDLFEHKALGLTNAPPDPLPDRKRERIDHSHRVFPSVRDHRFNEMEYAVPADAGPACFAEIRRLIHDRYDALQWPVEYRTLAADDVWLSPAYGRETVAISVHEDAQRPYAALFADCEAVFRDHGGRPHWGKLHCLGAAELAVEYEHWDHFWRLRAELDPEGRFLNDHLRRLGGIVPAPVG